MRLLVVPSCFVLLLCLFACSHGYDVVIYGATPSGIAAALTAARASPSLSIALIEPTAYIGGMVSAGGIGLRDTLFEDVRKDSFTLDEKVDSYLQFQ